MGADELSAETLRGYSHRRQGEGPSVAGARGGVWYGVGHLGAGGAGGKRGAQLKGSKESLGQSQGPARGPSCVTKKAEPQSSRCQGGKQRERKRQRWERD